MLSLKNYCKLRVTGSCVYNGEIEDAAIINDINNCLPDILIVDLTSGFQEWWITSHASQLNAKLCIAIGGVAEIILAEEKVIPKWVKKLHLSWFYEKLVLQQTVKKDCVHVYSTRKLYSIIVKMKFQKRMTWIYEAL